MYGGGYGMRVRVAEVGNRPQLLTAARQNAPQGAKAIADVLYAMEFADDALLTLDWERNALTVSMAKAYPEIKRRADIEVTIDMEDAFTRDQFGLDTVTELIDYLRSEFYKKNEEAEQMKGRT